MRVYLYSAIEILTQKKIKGEMKSESEERVWQALAEKNLYPQKIKEKRILDQEIVLFKPKVEIKQIHFFCKQLIVLIQAGISVPKALEICKEQIPYKTLKKYLDGISQEVSSGKTLSEAMKVQKVFPDLLVNLIACGESSGKLDEVINHAIEHLGYQMEIQKKVKKALFYPTMVMAFVLVVVIILMVKVVPVYIGLLNEIGAPLPLATKVIIQISDFLIEYGRVLFLVIVGSVFTFLKIKSRPPIHWRVDRMKIKTPLVGKVIKQSLSATFSSTMSMLIQSGVSMIEAIEMTKNVLGNAVAKKEMEDAIARIRQGESLMDALSKSMIFSSIFLNMIGIGEESGTLDEVLNQMGIYFKGEVERIVDNLTMLIEPIMIVIVAMVIGGIMAAIMLPTFSAAMAAM